MKKLKTKTLDQILAKELKSQEFRKEYEEEFLRLTLASNIKKLRTEKKLTQEMFAKKAQMPQSVIARIEGGKHTISLATLSRIAHTLGKRIQLV